MEPNNNNQDCNIANNKINHLFHHHHPNSDSLNNNNNTKNKCNFHSRKYCNVIKRDAKSLNSKHHEPSPNEITRTVAVAVAAAKKLECFNHHNNSPHKRMTKTSNYWYEQDLTDFYMSSPSLLYRLMKQDQLYQLICILCMIILFLNSSIVLVVGKAASSDQQSAYTIRELGTQFCLSCDSMTFQENIYGSNDSQSENTQLLFFSVGNEDMGRVEITLQSIPKLRKRIVLVLSSMNAVTFNIKIDESFPLERVICHSPIQSNVVFTSFYDYQTTRIIPVQYYCVKGSNCDYKILTTTSTVSWYGGGQLFTEIMSNHLHMEWRAFLSCSRASKVAVQPIGWQCSAVSDELIIYITLSLFLIFISFVSCIALILLRWYCIRVRGREEFSLHQTTLDFGDEDWRKSEPRIIQMTTTTVNSTTSTVSTIVHV